MPAVNVAARPTPRRRATTARHSAEKPQFKTNERLQGRQNLHFDRTSGGTTGRMTDETYQRALSTLFDAQSRPTPAYKSYLRCKQAYDAEVSARDDLRSAARHEPMALQNLPVMSRRLGDAIDAAMNQWLTIGYKNEIEAALQIVRGHESAAGHYQP